MTVLQMGDLLDLEGMRLPDLADLSEQQIRGNACAWCGTALDGTTAVDLGERRLRLLDGAITMFPRSCRPCLATRAYRALLGHTPSCEQCVDDSGRCETGRGLTRLIRENRR